MKGIKLSREQVQAHQERHGFKTQTDGWVDVIQAGRTPARAPKSRMNKTEAEFGLILEAMKRRGEVYAYFYEGITLHWGDCLRYTPDYVVYTCEPLDLPPKPLLIECKNAHIYPNGLLRFKGCRAQWKEYFDFEMWQKKAGNWSRIL